jgi:hypothetical protein
MLIAGLQPSLESMHRAKAILDTFKAAIRKFIRAADTVFGPGFLNMTEDHYEKERP